MAKVRYHHDEKDDEMARKFTTAARLREQTIQKPGVRKSRSAFEMSILQQLSRRFIQK